MIRRFYLLLNLLLLSFTGCSDDHADIDPPVCNNERQSRQMGFLGPISHVEILRLTDSIVTLVADFDTGGRCTKWNETGAVDGVAVMHGCGRATSNWMSTAASYVYHYDKTGRLAQVDCHHTGADVEHYLITYGTHDSWLPLPFPLGPFSDFMVQGVKQIKSENYEMHSDGSSAHSVRKVMAWMSQIEHADYQIESGRVVEQTMRVFERRHSGDSVQIRRVRTFYEYQKDHLSKTLAVYFNEMDLEDLRVETHYSMPWGYRPVLRRYSSEMGTVCLSEMHYTYDKSGRLISALDQQGDFAFEDTFSQEYVDFDYQGNWTRGLLRMDGLEVTPIEQKIAYRN